MRGRIVQRALGVLVGAFLSGAAFGQAPSATCLSCTDRLCYGPQPVSFPDDNPVWQLSFIRPCESTGSNGSGLEIRDLSYNGHLVMKRGHVPVLNVQYETGCGGPNLCYRDWQWQQNQFIADNILKPHLLAQPDAPPIDVCDQHQGVDVCSPGTPNCFDGVAVEKLSDHMTLTTQFEAGWYRYEMKWIFWLDGRIQPIFGFSAVADACTNHNHRHHAYWRLDFDLDGPANNVVTEAPVPSDGRGPRPRLVTLANEAMRLSDYPGISWSVINSVSRRGYRLVPGSESELPVDSFSEGDIWFVRYHDTEIDDHGLSGPPCTAHIGAFVNGETTSDDVVVWYRTGIFHAGGDLDDCHRVGPTLYPVGDWSP